MESAQNLINEVQSIKERYDRLLVKYNGFVTEIVGVKEVDPRLNDVDIHVHDNNSITIKYLDRELLARFSFSIDADGNRNGTLSCYSINSTPDSQPVSIHEFGFNAQGVADIPPNNGEDLYEIDNRVDAVNILFHWIRLSFNENS